ncbi:MAG: DNA-directed polymerase specialized sigma subunit, sigma24 [Glaciihabitans sp.]|nr:DNA-directed polymerase specialized sigma subunit, sigma24 [Glaciihabitans sp.]
MSPASEGIVAVKTSTTTQGSAAAAADKREAATFDETVRPLMPALLAYFARRVSPTEDAADCLSETLVVLWRRRSELPEETGEMRAWSFGVAKGVLANHQRSQLRRGRLSGRLREEISLAPPAAAVDHTLREAMAKLAPADRELVMLIAWDGFGVAEAGALLGLSPVVARARYSRARKTLREQLE